LFLSLNLAPFPSFCLPLFSCCIDFSPPLLNYSLISHCFSLALFLSSPGSLAIFLLHLLLTSSFLFLFCAFFLSFFLCHFPLLPCSIFLFVPFFILPGEIRVNTQNNFTCTCKAVPKVRGRTYLR
jgi:hypothetical protein